MESKLQQKRFVLPSLVIINITYFLMAIYVSYSLDISHYKYMALSSEETFLDGMQRSSLFEEFGLLPYIVSLILFGICIVSKRGFYLLL